MNRLSALVLVFALSLASRTLGLAKDEVPGIALHVLPDPGTQPTFTASDYVSYERPGTAEIHGSLPDPDANSGDPETCDRVSELLYPSTPFTRWMLSTWIRKTDGTSYGFQNEYPGDKYSSLTVPEYLEPEKYESSDPTAVIRGQCVGGLRIAFGNVPAGHYIIVGVVHHESADLRRADTTNVIVQTPTGEYPMPVDHGARFVFNPGNGYILTSPEVDVQDGHSYTLNPARLTPVARFVPFVYVDARRR